MIKLYDIKYDKTGYLALFYSEIFNEIFNRIRYLIRLKSNTSTNCSHNTKIKINSNDGLPLEKTITTHNVAVLIQSAFNENYNHYYYYYYYYYY